MHFVIYLQGCSELRGLWCFWRLYSPVKPCSQQVIPGRSTAEPCSAAETPLRLSAPCAEREKPQVKENEINDANTFALCSERPIKVSTYQRDFNKVVINDSYVREFIVSKNVHNTTVLLRCSKLCNK